MTALTFSMLLAALTSVILAAIEVAHHVNQSGSDDVQAVGVGEVVTTGFWSFCCLLVFGNVVTTLVGIPLAIKVINGIGVEEVVSDEYTRGIIYSFVGVFGFQAILKNLNVTFGDKGFLAINDWQKKARAIAVAGVVKSLIRRNRFETHRLSRDVLGLPNDQFDSLAETLLGQSAVDQLRQRSGGDLKMTKALIGLAMAQSSRDDVEAAIEASKA